MMHWRKKGPATPPERSAPDAELVHAVRRGDKRAFVEIVARHQAMVCGIALGILGDFATSEDAGQEAFLTAWRKFHDLREPDRLRPWLAQIARNAALGYLRRKHGDHPLESAPVLPDESPLPDEAAANEEEATLVRESLAKLPETYRVPLVLYYREEQSVRAVADALGISEDAVKQRLARGREMLRDRMAGVIETVLIRTAPTAIFTMTIAAAIGALAAPAVLAGSVFAAASAAGSTTAASSTSSILTAMSTSKAFLVATAVVAVVCVPIGYYIQSGTAPQADRNLLAKADLVIGTNAPGAAPYLADSALFAEWRQLHEKYGTNAAAMPSLYKAIAVIKEPFRRRAFRAALISEWVQVDPGGGLAFFLAKGPDDNQRRQFFEEWLAQDPRGSVDALLASGPGWETMARECLKEIARRVPSRVAEIAARLPKSESYFDVQVRDAFQILAEQNFGSARKAAEAMTGASREQALSGIAQAWAKTDLDAAITWAKALPEGTDGEEVIRAALVGKAAIDPTAALELVESVPPGGRYAHFAVTTGARVLAEAAKTDFDGTVAWLTAHPGRLGRDDMEGLAHPVAERLNADPAGFLATQLASGSLPALFPAIESALLNDAGGTQAAIWEWLKGQPDTDILKKLKEEVLRCASWQDPDLALRIAADLPGTAGGDGKLKVIAESMWNGGKMFHWFEKFYADAPEHLRQPMVEQAFNFLYGSSMDDPQVWINRLSLLPETSREKGVESIARAWAQQTPEQAIAWADSLGGESRNKAVAAIASAWAKKDAYGAADWIASMPPGAERDRGAGSLVGAVAEQFPREAWEWALSIDDPAERSRAAEKAAKVMAIRDPAAARQWIESGPFPPETKTQLRSALDSASRSQAQRAN